MRRFWLVPAALSLVVACKGEPTAHDPGRGVEQAGTVERSARTLPDDPAEPRLRNVRQLTFGGENAEAYWSWSGDRLVFQMRGRNGIVADQIHIVGADGSGEHMVSDGDGKTTCAYFLLGDREIVYASTRHLGPQPPVQPAATPGKYTWPVFDYEIWRANADGTHVRRLTENPGYDAEPTVGPDGRIVFTSEREGDLDIYTMQPDGTDVRRLTTTPGYDGGAFFSLDGTKICYRAHHPADAAGLAEFRELLASHRVQPTQMDIWIMNADGSDQRQVTDLGGASFAPYFHPDGERILFATNFENPRGRNFDLDLVGIDGSGLERVTASPEFDCFPMFSPDGRELVFSSNRNGGDEGDTNVFVAEWVE
jgi:Tol biopolymer transport system component